MPEYADPDADLFEGDLVEEIIHAFDDAPCESCGVPHPGENHDPLPEDVRAQLRGLLTGFSEGTLDHLKLLANQVPQKIALAASFMEFSRSVTSMNPHAPLIRAMAELVDENTNGELYKRWKVYEAEQELVGLHAIKKALNGWVEELRTQKEHGRYNEFGIEIGTMLLNTIDDQLQDAIQIYEVTCEEHGKEVDAKTIEVGIPSDASRFAVPVMKQALDAEISMH